jgi:hypothetical protein
MKARTIILFVIPFVVFPVFAEDVKDHLTVPFSNPGKPGHVEINLLKGGATITGYEGAEVDITAITKIEEESMEKKSRQGTNGMYHIPVSSSGMEVEEADNRVEIDVQTMKNEIDLDIKVPVNTSLTVHLVHDGDIVIRNVRGEIEAENVHGSIIMSDVSGSVAASTTHGDVKVAMTGVNPDKPMSFNTFHGDVDVTLPAALKANVKIKTTHGDVYSDFQITKTEKSNLVTDEAKKRKEGKYKVVIEHGFYGTIAGGGPEYTFTSYHGDILIRKVKGAQ